LFAGGCTYSASSSPSPASIRAAPASSTFSPILAISSSRRSSSRATASAPSPSTASSAASANERNSSFFETGAIVAVGCETEPVSKNDEFLSFAEAALEAVEGEGPDAVAGLEDRRLELIAKIGENVELVGAARMEAGDGELLAEYVHPPANKIGVLLRAKGADGAAARRLAMHISFAAPRYRSIDEVPEEELASERAIYENQPDVQSKPEDVRAKIVEGRLRKEFLSSVALGEQSWIHDPSQTVAKALEEAGLEVVEFVRYALAE